MLIPANKVEKFRKRYGRHNVDPWLADIEAILAEQAQRYQWRADGHLEYIGTSLVLSGNSPGEKRTALKIQPPWCRCPEATAMDMWPESMTLKPLRFSEDNRWMILPYTEMRTLDEEPNMVVRKEVVHHVLHSPIMRTLAPKTLPAAWLAWFDLAVYWHGRDLSIFKDQEEVRIVFLAACALQASIKEPILVHGDLLVKNILWDGARWRVVDPIPGVGELAYDVAKVTLGFNDLVFTENVVTDLSQYYEIDMERVHAWRALLAYGELSWIKNGKTFCCDHPYEIADINYGHLEDYANLASLDDLQKWATWEQKLLSHRKLG